MTAGCLEQHLYPINHIMIISKSSSFEAPLQKAPVSARHHRDGRPSSTALSNTSWEQRRRLVSKLFARAESVKRDRAVIATRFHRPQTSIRRVREMTQMCEAVMDGVRPVNVLCEVQRAAHSAWRAACAARCTPWHVVLYHRHWRL